MRTVYPPPVLEATMDRIDAGLAQPLDVYLLGGCAMSYLRLKNATKDLDVVLRDQEDLKRLGKALEAVGYSQSRPPTKEYVDMDADAIYAAKDLPQWDCFVGRVCKSLKVTDSMRERATLVAGHHQNLRIWCAHPSDILVFKSITDRKADEDDIDTIVAAGGADWYTILAEMRRQRNTGGRIWSAAFYQALERLSGTVTVPILDEVRRMAEEDLERRASERAEKGGPS